MSLFSGHDRFLGHYRRYSPAKARELVQGAGLVIEEEGSLFHSLYLARHLQKRLSPARFTSSDQQGIGGWTGGAVITSGVELVLRLDHLFTGAARRVGLRLPGLSWWGLCRKT